STQVCPPFQIRIGLVQTQEDEGVTQGENDLYFKVTVRQNGVPIYAKRIPDSGAFSDDNSHDLDLQIDPLIVPNDPELRIAVQIQVWDEDDGTGFGDDHLGTFDKELNISNGWGLSDNSSGIFLAGGISKIPRLEWAITPRQPPLMLKDFWETGNPVTPNLTYPQYAAAFSDVDDDPEWTDPKDWAEREFFARRVKDLANGGNCFGLCV